MSIWRKTASDVIPKLWSREGSSPEESLLLQEERMQIERSLLQLPLPQRVAVIMRDIDGLSYEEIADSMQYPWGRQIAPLRAAERTQAAAQWRSGLKGPEFIGGLL